MKKWFTVLLLMVFGCMCSACGMRITFDAQSSQPSVSETAQQPTLLQSAAVETVSPAPVLTDMPTSTQTPTPSPTPTQTPTTTPMPTTTPHIHSFDAKKVVVPPTCQKQGYTLYTCTCNRSYKDDYTAVVPHKFSDHICIVCGEADAYNRLKYWIFANGTTNGDCVQFNWKGDNGACALVWNETMNCIEIYNYLYGGGFLGLAIEDISSDNYEWGLVWREGTMAGYIRPSQFTPKTPVTCSVYEGSTSSRNDFLELSSLMLYASIEWFSWILDRYDIGLTLKDFGFLAW